MKHQWKSLITIVLVLVVATVGCSKKSDTAESQDSGVERAEHARDAHGAEEGEESGTEFGLDAVYDAVRNGARLVLFYDAERNVFTGTVENTTETVLERVRVEVHLSNGIELGPTTPVDLDPGEKSDVRLPVTSTDFDGWSAHPEVGSGEHGHDSYDSEGEGGEHEGGEHEGGEHEGGEHEGEERGEHG